MAIYGLLNKFPIEDGDQYERPVSVSTLVNIDAVHGTLPNRQFGLKLLKLHFFMINKKRKCRKLSKGILFAEQYGCEICSLKKEINVSKLKLYVDMIQRYKGNPNNLTQFISSWEFLVATYAHNQVVLKIINKELIT